MLQIRPNCELCDKDLPPDSTEARICTYECTFCAGCVDSVLRNVCPNCGGGLEKRPIRPANEHRAGVSLQHQPASVERKITKFNKQELARFVERLVDIKPEER